MSELNWHLPAAHFHRCFSTLQSLTNWWAHFSSICFSSSSEHVDTEDTEHEFPACFYSRELSLENKRKKKSWGFTSEWAAGDLRCIYVCSLLFLCFIFEEKNKPRRDQSHIWVNQMSSRAATYVAVCFWRFLSAVIGVFLSFFFFSPSLPRGEIRPEVTFRFGLVLKDTRADVMLAVTECFEWSLCVKWKDLWWLMCWVSLMTLEFFQRGFLKPLTSRKIHECW